MPGLLLFKEVSPDLYNLNQSTLNLKNDLKFKNKEKLRNESWEHSQPITPKSVKFLTKNFSVMFHVLTNYIYMCVRMQGHTNLF